MDETGGGGGVFLDLSWKKFSVIYGIYLATRGDLELGEMLGLDT